MHDHLQGECQVTPSEICGPSLNAKYSITCIWINFVVSSSSGIKITSGFSCCLVSNFFLDLQKPTCLNSSLIWKQ